MSGKLAALLAGAVLAIATQADAASCTQSDLTGNWRIEINTGTPNSNGIALDILSCLVRFQADGTLVPLACQAVNSRQGNSGTFAAFTNDRKFRITPGCTVSISGAPESSEDFEIQFVSDGQPTCFAKHLINVNWVLRVGDAVFRKQNHLHHLLSKEIDEAANYRINLSQVAVDGGIDFVGADVRRL